MRILSCSRSGRLVLIAAFVFAASLRLAAAEPARLLFHESFDDDQLTARGWYDGDRFAIARDGASAGAGSIEFHWKATSTTPERSSAMRRLFEPTDTISLRFAIKLS